MNLVLALETSESDRTAEHQLDHFSMTLRQMSDVVGSTYDGWGAAPVRSSIG
jgi:hypothetical protein